MTVEKFWVNIPDSPCMSTPVRGVKVTLAAIPLGIPRVGIPKGIAKAVFSLYHRLCRAELDSQPPSPNKLSKGGWELEAEVVVKEKNKEKNKTEKAEARRSGSRGQLRWCS